MYPSKAQREMPGFRPHLPPNDCPPPEATPADGVFYRLLEGNAAKPSDFESLHEQGRLRPRDCSPCEWAGLSLCQTLEDIKAARAARGKNRSRAAGVLKIARGTLVPDLGVVKDTPRAVKMKTHVTYWPYRDSEPWLVFEVPDDDT